MWLLLERKGEREREREREIMRYNPNKVMSESANKLFQYFRRSLWFFLIV